LRVKILLTGVSGQVGYELERCLQGLGEVVAPRRDALDLSDLAQVEQVVRAVRPQLIVNPAAYTLVDQAEQEPELAWRINAQAPAVMAQEARKPIFTLTTGDGAIGSHANAVKEAYSDFLALSRKIEDACDLWL